MILRLKQDNEFADECMSCGILFIENDLVTQYERDWFHEKCVNTQEQYEKWYKEYTDFAEWRIEINNILKTESNEDEFAPGKSSLVGNNMNKIVIAQGVDAIKHIEKFMQYSNIITMTEIITQLSKLDHEETRVARLELLIAALNSRVYSIRDAACMGLGNMDDPIAIPDLDKAILIESSGKLKMFMTGAKERLEAVAMEEIREPVTWD